MHHSSSRIGCASSGDSPNSCDFGTLSVRRASLQTRLLHASAVGLFFVVAAGFCGDFSAPVWGQAAPPEGAGAAEGEEDSLTPGIFLRAPRELRQNLSRALKARGEERYADVVTELGVILHSENSEDYFLEPTGDDQVRPSLKSMALQILGGMPAKGRQLYELQYGADARRLLDEALREGSIVKLGDVTRRYFHTRAGYEAAILLGRYQLDQGRPLAAALTLDRVASTPAVASSFDPELSVLLAAAWLHAGQADQSREVLAALKKRSPGAKVQLVTGPAPLFGDTEDPITWLSKVAGEGQLAGALAADQWVMFRGNVERNAQSIGSLPLVNYRWSVPLVIDPSDIQKVRQLSRSLIDRGEPSVSSIQPLAVDSYVIVRTPDRIVGINIKNGKRVWVYPWNDSSQQQAALASTQQGRNPLAVLRDQQLKQRIWQDNPFGQMSSDGKSLFFLDDLGFTQTQQAGTVRVFIGPGGRPIVNGMGSKQHNQLVSIDLEGEGKLRWIVGGENGEDEPQLAGAFFLGPPLPLADQLYVLAELQGEVRLICLNAATGQLEWRQQIAMMEDGQQVLFDGLRRLAGASPSYADGVLVCPTSGGAVVGVDLATRSLRWGYSYSRWDFANRVPGPFGVQAYRNPAQTNASWLDSTVSIADGCVIATPVESADLHCLDLLTGKPRWPAIPRDDMLYLACVHAGKAILVGKSKVKAVNLADGKNGWPAVLDLATDSPSGRGYYSGSHYYLPTTSQQLLKIDLAKGEIVSRAKTEVTLGNLICYRDELMSVSSDSISSFYLSEPLRKRIDEALAANPSDTWALTRKGEILLQEGDRAQSLELLRQVRRLAPKDDAAKTLLAKVMLSLLKEDFAANAPLVDELEPLIDQPQQRRELLRLRAQGLEQAGDKVAAFRAYFKLAEQLPASTSSDGSSSSELQTVDRDVSVRPDRWVAGRLANIYREAMPELRAQLDAMVSEEIARGEENSSVVSLKKQVELFRFHPQSASLELQLIDRLIEVDQLIEAELIAGTLAESSTPEVKVSATSALARIYHQADRLELCQRALAQLATDYASANSTSGETGAQLAAALAKQLQISDAAAQWPTGRTNVDLEAAEASRRVVPYQRLAYPIAMTDYRGSAQRGLRSWYDPQTYSIKVKSDLGRELVSAPLRSADNTARQRVFSVPYHALSAKTSGHLLVVSLGSEVVAVDALRAGRNTADTLLWRNDTLDIDPTSQRNVYPQQKQLPNPLTPPKYIYFDPTGKLSLTSGPVLPEGVFFQRGRQIVCADPITGKVIWERSSFAASCEIFGDREMIFVVAPSTDEATVLSTIDGSILGKRTVKVSERRWAISGRNVLTWDNHSKGVELRLFDAWSEQELWTSIVPADTKGAIVDQEEVALFESTGKLTIRSLRDASVRLESEIPAYDPSDLSDAADPDAPVDKKSRVVSITVMASRGQYLVLLNQLPTRLDAVPGMSVQPVGSHIVSAGIVHGRLFAFDRATGRSQWQVPAFISQYGLPQDQPSESPLLIFLRNMNPTGQAGSKYTTSLLVLDRRDGRAVVDSPAASSQSNSYEVLADLDKKSVTLTLWSPPSTKSIVMQLTDDPQPPQPPAQTGSRGSSSVSALPGTLDTTAAATMNAMQREAAKVRNQNPQFAPAAPPVPIPAPNPPAIPAVPAVPPR